MDPMSFGGSENNHKWILFNFVRMRALLSNYEESTQLASEIIRMIKKTSPSVAIQDIDILDDKPSEMPISQVIIALKAYGTAAEMVLKEAAESEGINLSVTYTYTDMGSYVTCTPAIDVEIPESIDWQYIQTAAQYVIGCLSGVVGYAEGVITALKQT